MVMVPAKSPKPDYTCLVCGASFHAKEMKPSPDGRSLLCPCCHGPGGYLVNQDDLEDVAAYACGRRRPLSLLVAVRRGLKVSPTPEIVLLTRRLLKMAMDAEKVGA
jgi:hypothetical protein